MQHGGGEVGMRLAGADVDEGGEGDAHLFHFAGEIGVALGDAVGELALGFEDRGV